MSQFNPGVTRFSQENEPVRPQSVRVVIPVTPITATSAGSAQVLLTVPDDRIFEIDAFKVCNATGIAATFTMHIVPSGGAAGAGNTIYPAKSIPPNDTVTLAERKTIDVNVGSTIEVHSGTPSALNITLKGNLIEGSAPA